MIINEKDIELSKPNRFPPITVKQGDNARQITARLFNDGEQFLVTSGLGVRLNAKRSDGQKNYSTGWVNDDGTVTVQITSWMVAIVGTVTCDISVFINEQQAFTTTNFYLHVEEATNKDGVIGGNDTPVDEQFAEIVLQIEKYIDQSKTYSDRSKNYSELAKKYAEQASTVDHIIEQNSGVPFKVWATDDKEDFDNLETKQQDTLYVYPSDVGEEAILNGTQPVGRAKIADNATKVNNLEITKDANGVIKIGDTIIPQKRLLYTGLVTDGKATVSENLYGKNLEIRLRYVTSGSATISAFVKFEKGDTTYPKFSLVYNVGNNVEGYTMFTRWVIGIDITGFVLDVWNNTYCPEKTELESGGSYKGMLQIYEIIE